MTEKDEWGVKPNEDFEVDFSDQDHRNYLLWRRDRDRIFGKASEPKEAPKDGKTQEAKDETGKARDKAQKPKDEPENAKDDAQKAKDKPEKTNDDVENAKSEADQEAVKDFTDRQLGKALEYLRANI